MKSLSGHKNKHYTKNKSFYKIISLVNMNKSVVLRNYQENYRWKKDSILLCIEDSRGTEHVCSKIMQSYRNLVDNVQSLNEKLLVSLHYTKNEIFH